MTALVWLLGGGLVAATAAVLALALLGRKDSAELRNVVDLLDGQRKLVAEFKHKFDAELVAHTVTTKQLEQERNLRTIAEAQRNEAQRRCRAYLARNILGATNDELNEILGDLFASPLSVVPKPEAGRTDDSDDIIDPFAEMQPTRDA